MTTRFMLNGGKFSLSKIYAEPGQSWLVMLFQKDVTSCYSVPSVAIPTKVYNHTIKQYIVKPH